LTGKTKDLLKLLAKLTITVGLLVFIFYRYIDLGILIQAFGQISYIYFIVVLLLALLYRLVLALQMKLFFNSVSDFKFSTWKIFKIQQIATFYGLVLPGDIAGGFVTWFYFAGESNKKADSAAVIIYTRLINIVTLLPFAAVGLLLEPRLRGTGLSDVIIILLVLSALLMVPFLWKRSSQFLNNICIKIINIIPWTKVKTYLLKMNGVFWDAIISCNSTGKKNLFYVFALSFFTQIIIISSTDILMQMVGINLPLSVSAWMIAVLVVVQLLPVSLAGIGVRDISLVYLLGSFYLVASEKALVLSTFFLIFTLIFAVLGGFYYLLHKRNKG
jgi:hypothetical protein